MLFDGTSPDVLVGDQLRLFEDSAADLTIHEVVRLQDQFKPGGKDIPNFGVSRSAFWARFKVFNTSTGPGMNIWVDHSDIEELDIYYSTGSGMIHLVHSGQLRPKGTPQQASPDFQYSLPIPYGTSATVYLRVKSLKQLQLPIRLLSRSESEVKSLNRAIFIGGYIGIMAVMVFYNLFIFLSIRERNYIYYIAYLISVCLTQLSFIGYAAFYLWPNQLWLIRHSNVLLTVVTIFFSTEFVQRFLNVPDFMRSFIPVKRFVYGLCATSVLVAISGHDELGYMAVQVISFAMAMYILHVAIRIAWRGHRPARFYLTAWIIFLAGIVVFVAKDWGLLPYNDLTKYMMTIGSAFEVVLLSFGLADKINILRRDKEQSQLEALGFAKENERIILEQNLVLDTKVRERTFALQESNDHLKRTQTQLVNAEKMASLGQLTAGIAHEINNPINFISSNIPPLKRDLGDLKVVLEAYQEAARNNPGFEHVRELERRIDMPVTVSEVQEIMNCIEQGASRTSEIVRGLRTFSRLDEDDLKQADLNEGLRSTTVVLAPQFRDAVKITFNLGALPEVECHPGKLNQAFMNLLNNAAHAVKKRHGQYGGEIWIGTEACGSEVKITISDNGIGMDEKVQQRLFEPFFTTKDVGEGTGLGLSITQGIIEKHHGRLELESAVGVGSTFTISLPVSQPAMVEKRA